MGCFGWAGRGEDSSFVSLGLPLYIHSQAMGGGGGGVRDTPLFSLVYVALRSG